MSKQYSQLLWNYKTNSNEEAITSEKWDTDEDKTETSVVDLPVNITRLSIQAPMGTEFKINGRNFIVGKFGVLEFSCEDIKINEIILLGKKSATLNKNETQEMLEEGIKLIDQAFKERLTAIQAIISVKHETNADNIYIETIVDTGKIISTNSENIGEVITDEKATSVAIENTFKEKYLEGYEKYVAGVRGVYDIKHGDVTSVKNVIIDIEYEEEEDNINE